MDKEDGLTYEVILESVVENVMRAAKVNKDNVTKTLQEIFAKLTKDKQIVNIVDKQT